MNSDLATLDFPALAERYNHFCSIVFKVFMEGKKSFTHREVCETIDATLDIFIGNNQLDRKQWDSELKPICKDLGLLKWEWLRWEEELAHGLVGQLKFPMKKFPVLDVK